MSLLHEVVQQIPDQDRVLLPRPVQRRHAHAGVGVVHDPVEGAVDEEEAEVVGPRRRHLPPNVRQLVPPPRPELRSVLRAHPDRGESQN